MGVRRRRAIAVLALIVPFLCCGTARASTSFGTEFPVGWYERFDADDLAGVAEDAVTAVLPYYGHGAFVDEYLDEAATDDLRFDGRASA